MINFIYGVLITWFLLGIGYSMWWGENNLYNLLMELPAQIVTTILAVMRLVEFNSANPLTNS